LAYVKKPHQVRGNKQTKTKSKQNKIKTIHRRGAEIAEKTKIEKKSLFSMSILFLLCDFSLRPLRLCGGGFCVANLF
jgi:hypothetical protein